MTVVMRLDELIRSRDTIPGIRPSVQTAERSAAFRRVRSRRGAGRDDPPQPPATGLMRGAQHPALGLPPRTVGSQGVAYRGTALSIADDA